MKLLVMKVLRAVLLVAGVLGTAALVSCGGGERVQDFEPKRLLVFGDENSVLDDSASAGNGRKYTVNGLVVDSGGEFTGELDCAANPIWVQFVASTFDLVFPECNPNDAADPQGRIYATPGATVADVTAQVTAHLAADSFSGTDLVTVLAGTHDVLAQYALYDGTKASFEALVPPGEDAQRECRGPTRAAGEALAVQVDRIANAGGKVLISTLPDIAYSPYARAEEAAHPGEWETRGEVIKNLIAAFNGCLRAKFENDGRKIGLVLADEQVQTLAKDPSAFGLRNVTTAVCDATKAPTVDQCTEQTLVTDGTSSTYLWADATHLSPRGHSTIGSTASTRATNNPF
jgi:phospholipase/lecithinase/hemolysin